MSGLDVEEALRKALGKPTDSDNPQWQRDVEAVAGKCVVLKLEEGDDVYLPGRPAEAIFVILEGLLGLGVQDAVTGCKEVGVGEVAGEGSVAVSSMPLAVAAEANGLPAMLVPQVERCFALQDTTVARIPLALYRTYLWRWRGHDSMCKAVIEALEPNEKKLPEQKEAEAVLLNGAILHWSPALWRALEPSQLRMTICQHAVTLHTIDAGEQCFARDGESEGLYILLHGELELDRTKDFGSSKVQAGAAFGEWAPLMPGRFSCSARATVDCKVLKLRREALNAIPETKPCDIGPDVLECLVNGRTYGERIPYELSAIEQFLQQNWTLFRRLEPKVQTSICQLLRVEKLYDGQSLWKCGEAASMAAIVLQGQVSVDPVTFSSPFETVVCNSGLSGGRKTVKLQLAQAGDILVEDAVRSALDGRPPLAHVTNAKASGSTTVAWIPLMQVTEVVEEYIVRRQDVLGALEVLKVESEQRDKDHLNLIRPILRHSPLMNSLPQRVLEQVCREATLEEMDMGEKIFAIGDEPEQFHIVMTGRVGIFPDQSLSHDDRRAMSKQKSIGLGKSDTLSSPNTRASLWGKVRMKAQLSHLVSQIADVGRSSVTEQSGVLPGQLPGELPGANLFVSDEEQKETSQTVSRNMFKRHALRPVDAQSQVEEQVSKFSQKLFKRSADLKKLQAKLAVDAMHVPLDDRVRLVQLQREIKAIDEALESKKVELRTLEEDALREAQTFEAERGTPPLSPTPSDRPGGCFALTRTPTSKTDAPDELEEPSQDGAPSDGMMPNTTGSYTVDARKNKLRPNKNCMEEYMDGDSIGESDLLDWNFRRNATAVAHTACQLLVFDREHLQDLVYDEKKRVRLLAADSLKAWLPATTGKALERLADIFTEQPRPKESTLVKQGALGDGSIWLVVDGTVKLSVETENHYVEALPSRARSSTTKLRPKVEQLGISGTGEWIGLCSALLKEPEKVSVSVASPEGCLLLHTTFHDLQKSWPADFVVHFKRFAQKQEQRRLTRHNNVNESLNENLEAVLKDPMRKLEPGQHRYFMHDSAYIAHKHKDGAQTASGGADKTGKLEKVCGFFKNHAPVECKVFDEARGRSFFEGVCLQAPSVDAQKREKSQERNTDRHSSKLPEPLPVTPSPKKKKMNISNCRFHLVKDAVESHGRTNTEAAEPGYRPTPVKPTVRRRRAQAIQKEVAETAASISDNGRQCESKTKAGLVGDGNAVARKMKERQGIDPVPGLEALLMKIPWAPVNSPAIRDKKIEFPGAWSPSPAAPVNKTERESPEPKLPQGVAPGTLGVVKGNTLGPFRSRKDDDDDYKPLTVPARMAGASIVESDNFMNAKREFLAAKSSQPLANTV